MKQSFLSIDEILQGYDAVSTLYPYVPPMLLWRSWEYAAYRRYALMEPVLDIGCGDGRYFQLVWPQIQNVVGVDMDPGVADAARRSQVYRAVVVSPAHELPTFAHTFASAFANCSLEHMDHLDAVLAGIARNLQSQSPFLLSVVTEKFVEWRALPALVDQLDDPARATALQLEYERYHHLVNPLPLAGWLQQLDKAGFDVLEHIAILPEMTSRLFLFLDHMWHVRRGSNELGDYLYPYLTNIPQFPAAFREIMSGVLKLEQDWTVGSGVVFYARKR